MDKRVLYECAYANGWCDSYMAVVNLFFIYIYSLSFIVKISYPFVFCFFFFFLGGGGGGVITVNQSPLILKCAHNYM